MTQKDQYEEIRTLPHHVSNKHPQMPMHDRAAQFSPFAALTGYDAAIKETGRLTDTKVEYEEEILSELDRSMQLIMERIAEKPAVCLTYYKPDERKAGGAYLNISGNVKKIDTYLRLLVLEDGRQILLDDIVELSLQ